MIRNVFVIIVTSILLGTIVVPVVNSESAHEKVPIRVSTSDGITTKKQLSIEDADKLFSLLLLNELQDSSNEYEIYLPIVLNELETYGLIEDSIEMEKAILNSVKVINRENTSKDFPFLFNICCFIAGYGDNSFLITPASFPTMNLIAILLFIFENYPLVTKLLEIIGASSYLYLTLRPRIFFPIGGWVVARKGEIYTLGLLGYQHKSIDRGYIMPPPVVFLILGFTGLWIGFLKDEYEQTFCIGSTVAIFGR